MSEVRLAKPTEEAVRSSARFKSTTYFLSKYYKNPTLQGRHYPITYKIPAVDQIYCEWEEDGEIKQGNRIIRFVPSERSIFADEQSEAAENPARLGQIVFTDGMLTVHGSEVLKKQYLDMCNWNAKNAETKMSDKDSIFFEENRAQNAEKRVDNKLKIHSLQSTVFEMSIEELRGMAMTFDIKGYKTMPKGELIEYFYDMIQYDPQAFEKEYNSEARQRKYWIMKAIDQEYFEVDKYTNDVFYSVGEKAHLFKVPLGQDIVDYFTSISMKPGMVKDTVDQVINQMRKSIVLDNYNTSDTPEATGLNPYARLADKALQFKIAERNGAWVKIINQGKWKLSQEKFIKFLEENEEIRTYIEEQLKAMEEKLAE